MGQENYAVKRLVLDVNPETRNGLEVVMFSNKISCSQKGMRTKSPRGKIEEENDISAPTHANTSLKSVCVCSY